MKIIDNLKRINARVYIFLSGILTGLCVIFPQIGFLAYFSMIPAFLSVLYKFKNGGYKKKKSAYADGFIFFMSYYVVVFHWFVYLYPLSFTGMNKPSAAAVVIVAVFGLSALQASVGALNFLWMYLFSKGKIYKRYPMSIAFFGASLWAILEWTQTLTWAGIPWGRLVLSQSEYTVFLQTVSLFGSYFITFLIVAVNILIAYALFDRKKIKLCPIVACAMIAANLVCGTVLYLVPHKETETVKAAALQGNMSSHDKWEYNGTEKAIEVYSELVRGAAQDGAELIVFPETAIPTYILEGTEEYMYFSSLAVETGATLVVGAFGLDDDGVDTNSLILFYPDGEVKQNAYIKQKLVPFGEFVPLRTLVMTLIPPLAEINMLQDDVSVGKESTIVGSKSDGGINIGSLICFDSIYESVSLESARNGAELIVMATNDSWFYDSRAVYMHNYQAKLRAIETGKYIVRAGNTGISSVISNKGDIEDELQPLVSGYIVSEVTANETRTLYSYIGNSFVYLLICADIAVAIYAISEKIKNKNAK